MKGFLKTLSALVVFSIVMFSCASAPTPEAVIAEEQIRDDQKTPEVRPVDPTVSEPAPAQPPVLKEKEPRPEGISEEQEPNNDPKSANFVDFGKPITVRIDPKGDQDWFRIYAEKQGYVQVQVRDVPGGIKPQVRFGVLNDMGDLTVVRNWRYLPDACAVIEGEYFICLIDDYNDVFSSEPFQLLIEFIEEMDAGETNDSPKTATRVSPGQALSPAIFPVGDADWFKIKVDQNGYLQVQARDVPGGLKPQVKFSTYDEWDGEKVIRNWRYLPDACAVTPGEFYICLIDDYNDAASPESFPLRIDLIPEMDLGEPNNSPKDAMEVKPGQTVNPAIFPTGDQDWFVISVEKRGYLQVTARDVPRDIKPQVRFITWDEWEGEKVVRNWRYLPDGCAVEPGKYYICLIDDYNDAFSPQTFPLRIEFLEEMDPAEPNDDFKQSKPFQPGETKTMTIYPTGDRDYYSVQLSQTSRIRLQAQDVPRNIGLEVSLWTPKAANPDELDRVEGYKKLPAEFNLEAGKEYFLLFIDDYNDASSPETFRVRMEAVN